MPADLLQDMLRLRNRIAILSEAYSYLDFKRRVEVTEDFVEEIARLCAEQGVSRDEINAHGSKEKICSAGGYRLLYKGKTILSIGPRPEGGFWAEVPSSI